MGILDNFILLDTVIGTPSVSMTKNGISFNKTTIEKLNNPQFVKALIDKKEKLFAIVPCDGKEKGSRPFYKEGRDTSNGVRWNNYDLKKTIEMMMEWNLENGGKKAKGIYSDEDNALIFNLSEATNL